MQSHRDIVWFPPAVAFFIELESSMAADAIFKAAHRTIIRISILCESKR